MYRNTRSYTLIRTLILASASLAIVGVLFAVYQSMTGAPPGEASAPGAAVLPPAPPAEGKGVPLGEGVTVEGGDRVKIRLYSPEGDRVRMELAVDSWEPVGEHSDQFSLTEPEIRLRTPDGQLVQVTADVGLVHLRKTEGDTYDPRRGRLAGNVRILVDRLNEQQRDALPPEERDNPGPDRLITINLEEVDFDVEYSRLETKGPFRVRAAEADIEGHGLALRYNELDSSVEELAIHHGGRIAVRGLGRLFEVNMPGETDSTSTQVVGADDPTEAEPAEVIPEPDPDLADGGAELPDDGIPVLPLDRAGKPRRHETVTYRAEFDGDVRVHQMEGLEVSGELLADTLELLFDFSQQQREAAQAQAAAPGGRPAAGDEPLGPGAAAGSAELRVAWTGPLLVTTVVPEGEDPAGEARSDRMQITAIGERVSLRQAGRGAITCRKLVFHQETERAWLYGTPEALVTIDTEDGGHLEGPEVVFDTPAGTARIAGPGRMWDARSGLAGLGSGGSPGRVDRRVDIRFRTELAITLAETVTGSSTDPATGATVERRRRYLETAIFRGNVVMQQGADSIRGQRIELEFGAPREATSLVDNMRRLLGEGGVVLVHGAESIECERIDVAMGMDESGRIAPRRAEAFGQVIAREQSRTIRAGERMVAELRSFRQPRPPFDLNRARAMAMARGRDPESIDWARVQAEYESKDEFEPGLLRLQAFRKVSVRDPEAGLRLDAKELDCSFDNGRDISRALVTGQAGSPAHVELNDFSITGEVIDLDVATESAEVPGPGRLTFQSLRDLDGRELENAIPVAINWSQRMTYEGATRRATLTGAVHAASAESVFDCGELIVNFAEPQRDETVVEAVRPDWWVFTPLVEQWRGRPAEDGELVTTRFEKEPTHLLATGGAVALTTKMEPGTDRVLSRGRIAAPRIMVDLRSEVLTIEDPGTLLIEDYELPKDRPAADQRTPFGSLGISSPSQTFVSWQGRMAYYFGNQAAVFERDVEMSHRSGAKILLGREVLEGAGRTVPETLPNTGRDAFMTCGQLIVKFAEKADPARPRVGRRAGAGRMAGYELSQFEASDGVHFEDGGIVVLAARVAFDAVRNELAIRGQNSADAEIYDQRNRFNRLKGPVFYWDRNTNRIDAPKSTVIGR